MGGVDVFQAADLVSVVVLKMSSHHEDSGLPSSGGLLHGHHGPAAAQPGSQPTGEAPCPSVLLLKVCVVVCETHAVCLCAGLPGSLSRMGGSDIKREDKEDDENCSLTDRSEDEKKDMKARLGSRCIKHFFNPQFNCYLSLI